MIDNVSILFSTVLVIFVIVRAAILNRSLPWFETRSLYDKSQPKAAPDGRVGQRPPAGRAPVAVPANRR